MRILDAEGCEIEDPDWGIGHLVHEKLLVAHHPAEPERQRITRLDHDNPVHVFPNGGKIVAEIVEQEYSPAVDAWDEFDDIMRYILYTPEELEDIAEQEARAEEERRIADEAMAALAKAAADREAFIASAPERLALIEASQLDADEAVASIYEDSMQARLDMDEALVAIYESKG